MKEARRQAKADGKQPIMVNSVHPVTEPADTTCEDTYNFPLTELGGTTDHSLENIYASNKGPTLQRSLTIEDIKQTIEKMWNNMVVFVPRPEEPPLKAYELDGRAYLDDGTSGRLELLDRTPQELVMVL